ncbi:MAG: VWA domain-containing protein, partial [Candidatus Sulfotelmatobacter sp.]
MKSSSIVKLLVRRSRAVSNLSFFSLVHNLLSSLLCVICCFVCVTANFAQNSTQTPAQSSAQAESKQVSEEIATRDEPTTFKVNSKLVVVRAVVRDSQGKAIGSLHQDDFQVFDKGKPQVITQFEVEQPGSLAEKARQASEKDSGSAAAGETPSTAGNPPVAPERFVAYLFDDVHLQFGDLAHVRESAEHHLASLKPTDRAAIFTTSGITTLGFTDDRTKLHEALLRL